MHTNQSNHKENHTKKHLVIKLLKTNDKENLKAAWEKGQKNKEWQQVSHQKPWKLKDKKQHLK